MGERDPRTVELYKAIAAADFEVGGDRFCFKSGGDGDNGEHLMDLLDLWFNAHPPLDEFMLQVLKEQFDTLTKARDEAVKIARALATREPDEMECVLCGGCLIERDHARSKCPPVLTRLDQLGAVGK